MIFETHGHYDDEKFDEDRHELLLKCKEEGIDYIMNIGADMNSSKISVELSKKYEHVYAAIGVHPECVGGMTADDINELRKMANENAKVKSVGEIGLDYYWEENPPKEEQIADFKAQLQLAKELDLPVVIHSRDAAADTMDILKEYVKDLQASGLKKDDVPVGVVHCYSYGVEQAREYVKMGFYIGVGGVVTFANSKKLKEVVADIPLEKIVLETDSPYLTPVPYRGKRNCALYLPYIAQEVALIKGISEEEVCRVTFENGKKLYRM